MPGANPFGHAPLFGPGFVGLIPAAELFGVIVGNDPGDGHVGMASNGEPVPVFGIPCGAPVAAGPAALFEKLWPSGVACHCVEFGMFGFGGGPMTIGAFGFGAVEFGAPFQRFAPLGWE